MQRTTVGLLVLLAFGLLLLSLAAEAQRVAHIPRVGFLESGHPGLHRAFNQGCTRSATWRTRPSS